MAYTPENNPYIPGDPYSYDLKWLVAEIKKAISLYTPLSTEFQELHDYVMDYFENLDLSDEIKEQLQALIDDGTIKSIIAELIPWESCLTEADIWYTTADYVYCTELDCWFWVHKNNYTGLYETDAGWKRETANTVYPRPNQSRLVSNYVPRSDVARVIESYIRQTSLIYGNDHTQYDPTVGNEMDCATFVNAILHGTTYENSRYVLGNSAENNDGYYCVDAPPVSTDHSDRMSLRTWYMAQWFGLKKQLYTLDEADDFKKLQFGDVLFSSEYDQDTTGTNARYYGTGHVAIVLQVYPDDGAVLVAQAGSSGAPTISQVCDLSVTKLTLVSVKNNIGRNYQIFARPNYGEGQDEGINITRWVNFLGTVTADGSNQVLANVYTQVPLSNDTLYTINIKGKLPSYDTDGCWLYVRGRTSSGEYNIFRGYRLRTDNKSLTLIGSLHSANGVLTPSITHLSIIAEESDLIGAQTFRVDEVSIVEGIDIGAPGNKPITINLTDTTNFRSLTNLSRCVDGKIRIQFEVFKQTTATGDFTIGTVDGLPTHTEIIVLPAFLGNTAPGCVRINTANELLYSTTSGTSATLRVNADI